MKNKKVKQMIVSVSELKKQGHDGLYEYDWRDGKLVFWINRIGRYTVVDNLGVVSLSTSEVRGQ